MAQTINRLRTGIGSGKFFAAPGAYDAFTALIIAQTGAEAIYLGGNALALALGKPQPLLSLDDSCAAAQRISQTVACPLIADLGSGFGGPPHVHHAVRRIEAAGVSAFHIDDQPYPKRFKYHMRGGDGGVIECTEMQAKIRAAAAARRENATILIARTDIYRVTRSIEAVIDRVRAYVDAGAEAVMALDLDPQGARLVKQQLPQAPLVWIGGVEPPIPNVSDLAAAGFAFGVYPFNTVSTLADAVQALWQGFASSGEILQNSETLKRMRGVMPRIVGVEEYWALEDPC